MDFHGWEISQQNSVAGLQGYMYIYILTTIRGPLKTGFVRALYFLTGWVGIGGGCP